MEENNNRFINKKIIVIFVLIVLVIVAVLIWVWQSGKPRHKQSQIVIQNLNKPTILNRAESGNLINGFDKGFIVDPEAEIRDSVEGRSPRPGYKMLVTLYKSGLSVEDVAKKYDYFFSSNSGWRILSSTSQEDQSTFYAVYNKTGETLQIVIDHNPSENTTITKVEYMKKINEE